VFRGVKKTQSILHKQNPTPRAITPSKIGGQHSLQHPKVWEKTNTAYLMNGHLILFLQKLKWKNVLTSQRLSFAMCFLSAIV
jgi:hypothetical protein